MTALLAFLLLVSQDQETPSLLEREPSGWTDLLADAGKDLKGWTRGPIPPGGKLNGQSQWSLDPETGNLVCEGNGGHEWLRYDKELGDFVYHIEWRFTPAEQKKGYNSGIYVRNSADATVWHQIQTGGGSGGYLFGQTLNDGKLTSFNLSKQIQANRVKPGRRVERLRDHLQRTRRDSLGQRVRHQYPDRLPRLRRFPRRRGGGIPHRVPQAEDQGVLTRSDRWPIGSICPTCPVPASPP